MGWLNYFGLSQAYRVIPELDQWVRRRVRMYYWKQWKRARTRRRQLIRLGIHPAEVFKATRSHRAYWFMAGPGVDPNYDGTVAEATAWGRQQAARALADIHGSENYPVVWMDVELPGNAPAFTPAPDNGWKAVYTTPCSGQIRTRHIDPAVDRGVQEAAERGVIAGYPLVDFRAECYDGSYHDVDSNEQSFKMAGILAFKTVAPKAKPVLLEPLCDVEVWTPDDVLGDVMGDLSARRGQILGTEQDGRLTKVRAIVPEAELYKYSTTLHSITHGRGTHRQKFHGYAEAPPEVTAKVAEEHSREREHAVAS